MSLQDENTYCATCAQVAILAILGHGKAQAGRRVVSKEYPAGCSERTIYNHVAREGHRQFIDDLVTWGNLARRETAVEVKEITAKSLRSEMEAALGDAWAQIKAAIKDGDVESAWRIVEYIEGKPKSNMDVSVTGKVLHGHVIAQHEEITERQLREIEESQQLVRGFLGTSPGESVMEAEVIPESAAPA